MRTWVGEVGDGADGNAAARAGGVEYLIGAFTLTTLQVGLY